MHSLVYSPYHEYIDRHHSDRDVCDSDCIDSERIARMT